MRMNEDQNQSKPQLNKYIKPEGKVTGCSRARENPNRQIQVTPRNIGARINYWTVVRPGTPVVRPAKTFCSPSVFSHCLQMIKRSSERGMGLI